VGHHVEYCPDEPTEFSGNGCDCDMTVFALVKSPELLVEAMLGFHGDGDDGRGLALATSPQDQIGATVIGRFKTGQ